MTKETLISIVMPLYNCEKYVLNSIESILNQTQKNWELIVVNDNSTDDSYEIVKKIMDSDNRVKLYSTYKNSGVAKARNYAIKLAKGDFIAFLDSDDIWLPSKLEKQINFMENEKVLLSYSSYMTINEKNEITGEYIAPEKVSYSDMLKTSSIGTLTTIYNAKELGKYYFENIGHEDYVMKLKILKKIGFARGITEPLAKYRISDNSLSGNKFKTALWQWKIYRDVENLSLIKSIYYLVHYVYFGLKKYK